MLACRFETHTSGWAAAVDVSFSTAGHFDAEYAHWQCQLGTGSRPWCRDMGDLEKVYVYMYGSAAVLAGPGRQLIELNDAAEAYMGGV